MKINKFDILLANLHPPFGTKPGKVRPVVVVQTDFLNNHHQSTIVCPFTSSLIEAPSVRLRVKANKESGLTQDSDILIDQILALDNSRLVKNLGKLDRDQWSLLLQKLANIILE